MLIASIDTRMPCLRMMLRLLSALLARSSGGPLDVVLAMEAITALLLLSTTQQTRVELGLFGHFLVRFVVDIIAFCGCATHTATHISWGQDKRRSSVLQRDTFTVTLRLRSTESTHTDPQIHRHRYRHTDSDTQVADT